MQGIERPYAHRAQKRHDHNVSASKVMGSVLRTDATTQNVLIPGLQRKKHIDAARSNSWSFRPSKRIIHVGRDMGHKRPYGLKHIPPPQAKSRREEGIRKYQQAYETNSNEITFEKQIGGQRRRVLDAEGYPCALRPPVDFDLEKEMGGKRSIPFLEQRRNGIPCVRPGDRLVNAAEYIDGFYKNHLHGGGYLPGSNFGFARATQTTAADKRVFGRNLAALWKKSPRTPHVVAMCLDFLQQREVLKTPGIFDFVEGASPMPPATTRSYQTHDDDEEDEDPAIEEEFAAQKEVKRFKRRFDKGQERTIDLSTATSPRVVAQLLYTFFEEMAPPLFTYKLYIKMLGTQRHETPEARLDALKPAISSLPAPSQAVLKDMVKYFNALLANAADNQMTEAKLGAIFGPMFIRQDPRKPKLDASSDGTLERTLASNCLECLLQNRTKLFSEGVLELNRKRHYIPVQYKNAIKDLLGAIDSVCNLKEWEKKSGVYPQDESDDEGKGDDESGGGDDTEAASKSLEETKANFDAIMADVESQLKGLKGNEEESKGEE